MSIDANTLDTLMSAWIDISKTPEVTESRYRHGDLWAVEFDGCTYAIGTQKEAEQAAASYIRDSLWAFRPEFLSDYAALLRPEWIKHIIGERCEDANDDILMIVGDSIDELINDAIAADGIGHFLNSYDGDAEEIQTPDGEWLTIIRVD